MSRILFLWVACFLLFGCKHSKKSLSGDEPVDAKEFMQAFPSIKLPFYAADTNINKIADTTHISKAVFEQFVPDSVLEKLVNKEIKKIKILPVGSIQKETETYLLALITQNKKTSLMVFVFDKKDKFLSGLELLSNNYEDGYLHSVSINREPTFYLSREKETDKDLLYTKHGMAYNNGANAFIEVVNDTNEDEKKNNEILNPIDTFARKNKLSGDYVINKKNFISLRDGKDASHYLFFNHFEKSGGDCIGELKGDMILRDATHAYFKQSGDPCVIDFTFEGNELIVKEQGNCGNHRGIKCYFDDTYKKKKEAKPKAKKVSVTKSKK